MPLLKIPVTSEDHVQGQDTASVTLVKYGDYQCPYCGQAYYVIKRLQSHFGKQLRFVFRNFPLAEVHPYATSAAETAEFAADHNRFWEMHDAIYENQVNLSIPLLLELATSLKLPARELKKAIETEAHGNKIQADLIGGARSGVNGTPTFFINNQRYDGNFDYTSLAQAIQSALIMA